jgi:alkylation response protein AidB-like acyl-CoA dehydrogenase
LASGGAGDPNATLAEVTAIISAADGSLGQIPQNHLYMVEAIRLGAKEEQKRDLFARVLAGDRFGNAFTEIGGKSPVDFQTRLTRSGDGYRLDGQKFYSTGAIFAHVIVVVALDENDRTALVFLERATAGLQLIDDWAGFGQRTTGSGTTLFDAVTVSPSQIVPHQDVFDRPTSMGPVAQLLHAAVDVGIARAALADTLDFTRRDDIPAWLRRSACDRGGGRAGDPRQCRRCPAASGRPFYRHGAEHADRAHGGRRLDRGCRSEGAGRRGIAACRQQAV